MALNYNNLTALTRDKFIPVLVDNIFNSNVLTFKLLKNAEKLDGGKKILTPIEYGKNASQGKGKSGKPGISQPNLNQPTDQNDPDACSQPNQEPNADQADPPQQDQPYAQNPGEPPVNTDEYNDPNCNYCWDSQQHPSHIGKDSAGAKGYQRPAPHDGYNYDQGFHASGKSLGKGPSQFKGTHKGKGKGDQQTEKGIIAGSQKGDRR